MGRILNPPGFELTTSGDQGRRLDPYTTGAYKSTMNGELWEKSINQSINQLQQETQHQSTECTTRLVFNCRVA